MTTEPTGCKSKCMESGKLCSPVNPNRQCLNCMALALAKANERAIKAEREVGILKGAIRIIEDPTIPFGAVTKVFEEPPPNVRRVRCRSGGWWVLNIPSTVKKIKIPKRDGGYFEQDADKFLAEVAERRDAKEAEKKPDSWAQHAERHRAMFPGVDEIVRLHSTIMAADREIAGLREILADEQKKVEALRKDLSRAAEDWKKVEGERRTLEAFRQMLSDWGICTKCGAEILHHEDEPFASCNCGTREWTGSRSKLMEMRKACSEPPSGTTQVRELPKAGGVVLSKGEKKVVLRCSFDGYWVVQTPEDRYVNFDGKLQSLRRSWSRREYALEAAYRYLNAQ